MTERDLAWEKLSLEQVFQDLSVRFIINLPEDEMRILERVFFQIEQAHWYYEDFIRPAANYASQLPPFTFKKFSKEFSKSCPILKDIADRHEQVWSVFQDYKGSVPVCGAILISDQWDKILLVKGYRKASTWSFPRGKINHQEDEFDCAVREVQEEVGFDIRDHLFKHPVPGNEVHPFLQMKSTGHQIRLYLVPYVPETTLFQTQTRKEISKIAWFFIDDLISGVAPKTYNTLPFVLRTKRWIRTVHPTSKKGAAGKKKGTRKSAKSSKEKEKDKVKDKEKEKEKDSLENNKKSTLPSLSTSSSSKTAIDDEATKQLNQFFFGNAPSDSQAELEIMNPSHSLGVPSHPQQLRDSHSGSQQAPMVTKILKREKSSANSASPSASSKISCEDSSSVSSKGKKQQRSKKSEKEPMRVTAILKRTNESATDQSDTEPQTQSDTPNDTPNDTYAEGNISASSLTKDQSHTKTKSKQNETTPLSTASSTNVTAAPAPAPMPDSDTAEITPAAATTAVEQHATPQPSTAASLSSASDLLSRLKSMKLTDAQTQTPTHVYAQASPEAATPRSRGDRLTPSSNHLAQLLKGAGPPSKAKETILPTSSTFNQATPTSHSNSSHLLSKLMGGGPGVSASPVQTSGTATSLVGSTSGGGPISLSGLKASPAPAQSNYHTQETNEPAIASSPPSSHTNNVLSMLFEAAGRPFAKD